MRREQFMASLFRPKRATFDSDCRRLDEKRAAIDSECLVFDESERPSIRSARLSTKERREGIKERGER
jgi:hypothetical protein